MLLKRPTSLFFSFRFTAPTPTPRLRMVTLVCLSLRGKVTFRQVDKTAVWSGIRWYFGEGLALSALPLCAVSGEGAGRWSEDVP